MISYNPKNIDELQKILQKITPSNKLLSGGTDLVIEMHSKKLEPDELVYLGDLADCKYIIRNGNFLEIGACVTMLELANAKCLEGEFNAIMQAACDVGSPQIRTKATIGGNIGNASPASDLSPVLVAFEAIAVVMTPDGVVRISVKELLKEKGRLNLPYNNAIIGFEINLSADEKWVSAFYKLGFREKVSISRIGLALVSKINDGRFFAPNMVVGAVSPYPLFVEDAMAHLDQKVLSDTLKEEMAKDLSNLIYRSAPGRSYKVRATMAVIEDTFALIK